MCVGTPIQSSLNIFWDLPPCHLQNGADITGYIIQYSRTSVGEAQNISTSNNRLTCGVFRGYYRCLITPYTFFLHRVLYIFQVAAVNRYGLGPYSDPIITEVDVQSILIIIDYIRLSTYLFLSFQMKNVLLLMFQLK